MAYTDYLERVQESYIGYYQRPADPGGLLYWAGRLDGTGGNMDALIEFFSHSPEATALYPNINSATIGDIVDEIYLSFFNRTADAAGKAFYVNGFNNGTFTAGTIMLNILDGAQNDDLSIINNKVAAANIFTGVLDPNLDGQDLQATYVGEADAQTGREWLAQVGVSPASVPNDQATTSFISLNIADYGDPLYPHTTPGTIFTLTSEPAAGAEAMRLTGDQDVRIDFTNPANQVTGLDLNGDGVIARDGHENNITGVAANFEIVDAYARNPLNQEIDITNNFFGDIAFDGTGFQGDGVSTNGNIFLGGLGLDLALGGIGNDFMVGGGISQARQNAYYAGDYGPRDTANHDYWENYYYYDYAVDELYGGRNADFFFAELSRLDSTDGNSLFVHGGFTSDDTAVSNNSPQDTDWLLLEVSDDEDGATVDLRDEADQGLGQYVHTGAGSWIWMDEIENIDASGNLYGFVNDVNVALGGGGTVVDGENVGIGSSAQLEIIGSVADNTLIGGFDNDRIYGEDGNDLLMGGNLNYLNNPNMLNIVNNGMDELYGGAGDDNIVFEADGGIIDGDGGYDSYDYGDDTLYVTKDALGTQTAAEMLADGVLRFELQNGDPGGDGNDTFAGYGGADVDYTSDQTNYVDGSNRVSIWAMENVIATGMGAVDYLAAGANDPELVFNNQQNHLGYTGDLDLRGTAGYYYDTWNDLDQDGYVDEGEMQQILVGGDNILYANTGNDVIEGREGDDLLSGGDGRDDFYFQLSGNASWEPEAGVASSGDGVDVIHRQADANGDNIWDTDPVTGEYLYAQDFGIGGTTQEGASFLTVDFNGSDLALPGVAVTTFDVTVDGVLFVGGNAATLSAFNTVAELATYLNTVFNTQDATVSVTSTGDTVIVTKADGGVFGTDIASGTIVAGTATNGPLVTQIDTTNELDVTTPDRLIFKSYEDRSDNEGVDDDAVTGSQITLGRDSYAQDLVVDFAADGTRIAEDQGYWIQFNNLTTEDKVTINVNGVTYQLQVGVSQDGTQVDGEDGVFDTQTEIQNAFVARFADFINSFMDDDTAAGSVWAYADGGWLWLAQNDYSDGENTVFMKSPVVEIENLSGGEAARFDLYNYAQSELHLLDYAGTNNDSERLTDQNVLFIGEEGVEQSRAVLATALIAGGPLAGSDALVINGGADDLIGVPSNRATDSELWSRTPTDGNFVVHGDDYLIGGVGNDTITGGTGDDRIRGSLGTDDVDGGKDLYAVREVGQAKFAVETLNAYEALQRDLDPGVLDIYLLRQTESADVMVEGADFVPYFQDTLLFQQADFSAGATEFTIDLNNFLVSPGAILLNEGGAGTVQVDVEGDGVFESTTTFTNFEHIRTVSGVDLAVADNGQGNDTLILTDLSDASFVGNVPGGVYYNLTNDGEAGLVNVHWDTWDDVNHNGVIEPGELDEDHDQDIIYVDGVENIIGGAGHDWVDIDETEAAKDNYYDGGADGVLGDGIGYYNDFGDWRVEPTVKIVVESAADTDEVIMSAGRVGTTVATDTLVNVEYIGLYNNTAAGVRENDVLDVTNVSTDVVVDFVHEEVTTGGDLLVTIGNMYQMENVLTDASDTVIVGDADIMSQNDRADTSSKDLVIDTYLNYDSLDPDLNRESVADMRANNEENNYIPEARNFGEFTFNLGIPGTDRVDYSQTDDQIAAVVDIAPMNYVMVDGGRDNEGGPEPLAAVDGSSPYSDFIGDRVDRLISVEQIVASTGESILDFTGMNQDVEISFQFDEAGVDVAKDRLESLIRIADGDGNEITGIPNFIEYYDVDKNDDVDPFGTAAWNRIEGSDFAEKVFYDGSEDLVNLGGVDHRYTDDTLNLRGGDNGVSYFALETSITALVSVTEFDAENPFTTGLINADITFQDGSGGELIGGGEHVITSYTGDNGIAPGSLKLEASQDAEDTVTFESLSEKVFFLGASPGVIDVQIGELPAMRLTGFEILQDAESNDVYRMEDLNNVIGNLTLVDNPMADTDTILVQDDAVGYGAMPADTIDLGVLNAEFAFDFDVLDVTEVTKDHLTLIGTDEGPATTTLGTTVALLADPPADATTTDVLGTSPITVTVSPAYDKDWYMVNLVAAESYQFDYVAGTNTDPKMALMAPDGMTEVAWNDDSNDTLNSQISYTAGETGTYYLDAYGYASHTGDATLSVTVPADDKVVLGDLDLVDDVQLFEGIAFTDASITSAGSTFTIDMDGGEFLAGGTSLFTFDASAGTFDFSRVTADVTVSVTDVGGVGVTVIGGSGDDTITGDAGNDYLTGGAGADALDGGIIPEVLATLTLNLSGSASTQGDATAYEEVTDGTGAIRFYQDGTTYGDATGAFAGAEIQISAAGGLTVASSSDVVGTLIAGVSDADWATYLPTLTIKSVNYSTVSNDLVFTYASGTAAVFGDLLIDDVQGVAADSSLEGDNFALSGGLFFSQGDLYAPQGDSADTYVYNAASDSTQASMDAISNFTINNLGTFDTLDFSALGLVGSTLTVDNAGAATFASLALVADAGFDFGATVFVGRTATDGYAFVDANENGNFDAGSDMVIKLTGISDLTGFDGDNVAFV